MAMTEEQQRIRSYLTAQAAKLSPPELIDKVRGAMGELSAAASAVPGHRFSERPAHDEWSGNEVLAHVVKAGAHFGNGITRILDGDTVTVAIADVIEAGAPERSAAEWLAQFDGDRAALFERVRRADPRGHLDRTIEHPFFGPLNWREALLFLRLHDLDHAGQLRKIATALT